TSAGTAAKRRSRTKRATPVETGAFVVTVRASSMTTSGVESLHDVTAPDVAIEARRRHVVRRVHGARHFGRREPAPQSAGARFGHRHRGEEPLRVRMLRILHDRRARADLDDLAEV